VTAVEPTTMAMALGFLTGIMVGLTGMGGGALLGPALILGLGVPPVVAVGVDLVHSAVIKLVGGPSTCGGAPSTSGSSGSCSSEASPGRSAALRCWRRRGRGAPI